MKDIIDFIILLWYQSLKPIHFFFFPCLLTLMAIESNPATILNTNESHQTLISINVVAQAPLKLTSTNYLSWKL